MSADASSVRTTGTEPRESEFRRIADRYELEGVLGKGGMATAYRALDTASGKYVALKLLSTQAIGEKGIRDTELFEREYHTLVQLAHPRVVQVFEYGMDGETPYYTMELLDGGDLQALAPMRWQDAAVAAYEIGSALSMLHSRRLVHRDLTPRNIRRTADGKAKLIDFGLLSPMGPPSLLAGTPPFVPPELVNWVTLDGRSDLFSLGATLYYVLTGRHAFPARRFDQLRDTWRSSPMSPSKLVHDIPAALDAIVLSLLRIDAGSRPKSAAEVMERLLPLLPHPPDDELRVATAHLTTPRLVGRNGIVQRFRKRALGAGRRRGGGFIVVGEAGSGRSRMLDAFVLEGKLAGALTARSGASNAAVPFGVAATLAAQLHAAAPATSAIAARANADVYAALFRAKNHELSSEPRSTEGDQDALIDVARAELDHRALHAALRAWLLELSRLRPLALAIDDFDEVDEASAALLASLTWEAPRQGFVYAVSAGAGGASTALDVVQKHAERIELGPLDLDETTELLSSIFGDTANLQLLSRRLHALCGGRPRECMVLAQFLVDRGVITYSGGAFTLPSEVDEGMLPASMESAFAEQIARLSPLARRLAALLSLELTERLSRAQLIRLQTSPPASVDAAVNELLAMRLVSGDDTGYALRERSLTPFLTAGLTDAERRAMHEALSELDHKEGLSTVRIAYHRLLGVRPEAGLDFLLSHAQDSDSRTALAKDASGFLGAERCGMTFNLALSEALRLGRPKKDLQVFWVMLAGISAQGEDARYYYDVPADWLEQLKRETGWYDWQALDPSLDPAARAMMALGAAAQRYAAAAENDRALSPPEALKQLVGYVVFSISVAARVFDLELQASLPALLEPFALLDPMVAAMLANARGTLLNGTGKREEARDVFKGVESALSAMSGGLAYGQKIREAISQTLAEIDASIGVKSIWTERLGEETVDSNHRVGARYIQKVSALHQGDWEAAERYRQQAELTMLQSRARPMFSTLGQELEAHAMANDLTGLRQVRSSIHAMAEQHPGWAPVRLVADAHYQ
ncbi:MAG TPA: protein kinase, partial [Polyangiaceae bacterium]|nr:protein kinase [Polyangiaceae bacterium]